MRSQVRVLLSPPQKIHHPTGGGFFVVEQRARTHLNATPQWGVARRRLDGGDTLNKSVNIQSGCGFAAALLYRQIEVFRNGFGWLLHAVINPPAKGFDKGRANVVDPESLR